MLEQLVGEIEDEYDLPDGRITRTERGELLVTGSLSLDDLAEQTTFDLPRVRARTVAGLLFEALGRRPTPGDTVTIAGTELRIEAVEVSASPRCGSPGSNAPEPPDSMSHRARLRADPGARVVVAG